MWGLWWTKWQWDGFSQSYSDFPSISLHWGSILIRHAVDEQQDCWRPQFGDIVLPHRHEQQPPPMSSNISGFIILETQDIKRHVTSMVLKSNDSKGIKA
jgi:hypothetical protein